MFNFIKNLFRREFQIFFSSDLHLDHANIIRYCNRPYKDVHEMNYWLIRNWNKTVGKGDTVYFLGDLAFAKGNRKRIGGFMNSLNGKKIFIKGNHDKYIRAHQYYILKYEGQAFYLTHEPRNVPKNWKGWAICGHGHQNAPFIDRLNKRINVSPEVTRYKPVNIKQIISEINS